MAYACVGQEAGIRLPFAMTVAAQGIAVTIDRDTRNGKARRNNLAPKYQYANADPYGDASSCQVNFAFLTSISLPSSR